MIKKLPYCTGKSEENYQIKKLTLKNLTLTLMLNSEYLKNSYILDAVSCNEIIIVITFFDYNSTYT